MKKIIPIFTIGLVLCTASSYARYEAPPVTADLGFVSMNELPAGNTNINPIRVQALQETAFTLGAQGALAWRTLQINVTLNREQRYLDRVFDFSQLLIHHTVLPPVLVEGDDSLDMNNDMQAIRTASKMYRIIAAAQFVTAPPTWRTYLMQSFPKPVMPDHTLLPTTQAEADVWNCSLKQGWKQGLQQANSIFSVNLNRLKRDYLGMVLYNKLLQQHIVSPPYVAQADLGVTGNSEEIRINDQVTRITEKAKLQPDSSQWTPVVTKSEEDGG